MLTGRPIIRQAIRADARTTGFRNAFRPIPTSAADAGSMNRNSIQLTEVINRLMASTVYVPRCTASQKLRRRNLDGADSALPDSTTGPMPSWWICIDESRSVSEGISTATVVDGSDTAWCALKLESVSSISVDLIKAVLAARGGTVMETRRLLSTCPQLLITEMELKPARRLQEQLDLLGAVVLLIHDTHLRLDSGERLAATERRQRRHIS